MKLSNNTILITGGGSGIGLALAEQFLKQGNKIIICGRNLERLEKAKQKFPALNIIQCDTSDAQSVREMVAEINNKYPRLNFLINNAGKFGIWNIQKHTESMKEQKEEIMTNVVGTIQLTQSLIPTLARQSASCILNVTSGLAFTPFAAFPVYCATKAALHSYTVSIREQLQNTSIKVFETLPPLVDTEMVAALELSMPKITTEKLALATLKGIKANRYEMRPGMSSMMYMMNRFLPSVMRGILAKDSKKVLAGLS